MTRADQPPRFRIQGGWSERYRQRTDEGWTDGRKSLYLILDGYKGFKSHFPAIFETCHEGNLGQRLPGAPGGTFYRKL